jgi:hypothetical protein
LLSRLSAPPVFIVGAARSGTTWVYDIFCAHPRVGGVFESWLFTLDKGLGALFNEVHWPPQNKGLGRVLTRDDMVEVLRPLAQSILARGLPPGADFLVEKSPSHVFTIEVIAELLPTARFVHVLRDGRDVAVSVRAAARSWVPAWRSTFGRTISSSARTWRHTVQLARAAGNQLGDRFLEIRFEDIKRQPRASYARLFSFAGIPHDSTVLDNVYQATDFDMNYKPRQAGFRRKGIVGDWLTELGLLDRILFHRSAYDMLRQTGYELSPSWILRRKPPGEGHEAAATNSERTTFPL